MKRYFKYRCNESLIDNSWGFSSWYNEFDEDFYALRQIEIYDNGTILKYDEKHFSDEFGMLCDQSFTVEKLKESHSIEISQEEFESVWATSKALNE